MQTVDHIAVVGTAVVVRTAVADTVVAETAVVDTADHTAAGTAGTAVAETVDKFHAARTVAAEDCIGGTTDKSERTPAKVRAMHNKSPLRIAFWLVG